MFLNFKKASGICACASAIGIAAAQAQVIEEITVTAQKREQSAQDVGITINALSGDMLEEMGLLDSNELAAKVPNLNIHSPAGEGGVAVVFIRGVGLNDFATNNTGPVGFYVDEVYAGSSNAQVTSLFDTERVEVLKGPQGTLFGRNTTGGAINIVSRKPTEEFEGYADISYGDYAKGHSEFRLGAAASGPLSDTLTGRVALTSYESGGYMKNLVDGEYVEKKHYAARALLDWAANDDVDVLVKVHGSKNDSDADFYNSSLDENFYEGVSDIAPKLEVEQAGASAKIDWRLSDGVTLTSITAYDTLEKFQEEDADMLPFPIIHTNYGVESDTWSQEFRLTGSSARLDWIGGLYFWSDDLTQDQGVDLTGAGLPIPYVYDNRQDTDTWALFGQIEYQLNDALVLVGGVRYTDLSVDFESIGSGTVMLDSTVPGGLTDSYVFSDSLSDDSISGKLALNWHASDQVMYYASAAKGFKGAGFNGNFHLNVDGIGSYKSEDLMAYELGMKSMLGDGKVRLNMSVFYYDYSDAQIFNNAPIPGFGLPANRIENADITIRGADIDFTWQPVSAFYVQAGIGFTDGEYDQDIDDPVTGLLPIKGNRLQNTPEWSAFGLARFERSLGDAGMLSARLDLSYSDDVYYSNFQDSVIGQDSFTLTNARLAWLTGNERLELALWAKNLTNEEYRTYAFDLRPDFGFVQYMRGAPRTVGVDVRVNF
jgi:iron complex outermembrane receptor protein